MLSPFHLLQILPALCSTRFSGPPEHFNPKIEVAACFISVNGQFLFLKQAPDDTEPNTWGIPGGKLQKNENAEQGVLREVKEETGLDLPTQSLKYLGKVYIRYPYMDYIYHMFEYNMEGYPEEVVIDPTEHTEYRWISTRFARLASHPRRR